MRFDGVLFFSACLAVVSRLVHCDEAPTEPTLTTRWFSEAEIAEYDGSDPDKPIYMSVKGTVFDVTSGKSFYGKGEGYNALVGGDRSVSVARMSLEPEDLAKKHDLSVLSQDERKSLDEIYESLYMVKYPVVGKMDFVRDSEEQPLSSPPAADEHTEL